MKRKWWMTVVIVCAVVIAALFGRNALAVYEKNGSVIEKSARILQDPKGVCITRIAMIDLSKDWDMEEILRVCQEYEKQQKHLNQYIAAKIAEMSLEEKLAQMMILTNENDITDSILTKYQPGGIILFSKDFKGKSVAQVRERVDTLQTFMKLPLFIGVDEEGGVVSRIAGMAEENLPHFQSARVLYETGGIEAVQKENHEKAIFLKRMGINLNFDPVADVVENKEAYMYDRSASGETNQVAEYVETVITAMKQEKIGTSLKHFPGYGNNVNTHKTFAVDKRKLSIYRKRDFIPFQRGVAAGADMVMVSHIVMSAVDKDNPASLSLKVHDLLRKDLGFSGVVIADDLNMGAILNSMTLEEATLKALAAENDMIFSADFMASMKGAKAALEQGKLTEQQIDESLKRILRMKINLGLIVVDEEQNEK